MVDSQEIRAAFAARLNISLDGAEGVRKGRGRNTDLHAALKKIGVEASLQATNKWLRAESIPEKDNLRALANWLKVRAEWLEYGEGEMRVSSSDVTSFAFAGGPAQSEAISPSDQAPTYIQADKYQKATPEHRKAVDDLVDQLLDLSPEQALKVKQAMELLIPPHDPRKD